MVLVTTNELKLQKEPSNKIKKRRTINSSFSKKNHLNVNFLIFFLSFRNILVFFFLIFKSKLQMLSS